jgi:hypothetical protein
MMNNTHCKRLKINYCERDKNIFLELLFVIAVNETKRREKKRQSERERGGGGRLHASEVC